MYSFKILQQYGPAFRRIGSSTVKVGAQKCERIAFTVYLQKKRIFFGKVQKSTCNSIERRKKCNSSSVQDWLEIFDAIQRLEFQRITAQQTQVRLSLS
jgi:hypothetical protein